MRPATTSPRAGATEQLGAPHLHFRRIDSTNAHARSLAAAGAPHGTLVTADEQTAGRGRQGRTWSAPPGRALLMSLVLREPDELLSLVAGVAACDAIRASGGDRALLKWPNDVVLVSREGELAKCAGLLVEGRPQEGWAVLGIGINVALGDRDLPPEIRAASLGLAPTAVADVLERLLAALTRRLAEPSAVVLEAWRDRDALRGHSIHWAGGSGVATGIDDAGRLQVTTVAGTATALDAGEVHVGLGGVKALPTNVAG